METQTRYDLLGKNGVPFLTVWWEEVMWREVYRVGREHDSVDRVYIRITEPDGSSRLVWAAVR